MVGRGAPIERLPETITGGDAAQRLLAEIATRYVEKGCRVKNYGQGIRIYDCKDSNVMEQSFEWQGCEDGVCDLTASETEYGKWTKADRAKYLKALEERGVLA